MDPVIILFEAQESGFNPAQTPNGIPKIMAIIRETTEKVLEIGPEKSQTGPAKRGDKKTIEEHEKFLTNKEYKKLYLIITQLIEKKYESRKL